MMNDLELCKAIAESELEEDEWFWSIKLGVVKNRDKKEPYNPLKDKALLFDLIIKHEVTINYYTSGGGLISIVTKFNGSDWDNDYCFVDFYSRKEIEYAICECILKSKGLWHD